MILHGWRAGFPVVTDTGCCPSAARRGRPDLRDHRFALALKRTLASCQVEGRSDCFRVFGLGLVTGAVTMTERSSDGIGEQTRTGTHLERVVAELAAVDRHGSSKYSISSPRSAPAHNRYRRRVVDSPSMRPSSSSVREKPKTSKAEDVEVGGDPLGGGRLGDHHQLVVDVPAHHDPSGRHRVTGGDLDQHRVAQVGVLELRVSVMLRASERRRGADHRQGVQAGHGGLVPVGILSAFVAACHGARLAGRPPGPSGPASPAWTGWHPAAVVGGPPGRGCRGAARRAVLPARRPHGRHLQDRGWRQHGPAAGPAGRPRLLPTRRELHHRPGRAR
jgi:hypothetical protein